MELSIRTACENDAPSMVALLDPIIAAGIYTVLDAPITVDDQVRFIRSFPERGVFHVAVRADGRRVVGMQDVVPVSAEPALRHVGEISTFVALDCHRHGVGERLCSATFEAARARGYRKLMATIRADNPQAVSFYRGQGFEVVGVAREHAFVGGGYVDVVIAERSLARAS